MRTLILIVMLGAAAVQASAQSAVYDEARPVARAGEAATRAVIEGMVLGDAAWEAAPVMSEFSQTTPDEGQSASEKTEVRVMYTPEIDYDAQVSNEGQGGLNVNWDASWTVAARTNEHGWSAEFAIPFRTLRFNSGDDQVWGINFERTIRRRNETAYWAPLPRQYGLSGVSRAGSLEGLSVRSPRNLQFTPYVLGQGGHDVQAIFLRGSPARSSCFSAGGSASR